ncbi:MAG: triose-phosphate isomerase [Thermodesulfobacteriota bacterium]
MEKRTPFIAGNWKMHKTPAQAAEAARALAALVDGVAGVEVMIAPTFLSIPAVAEALAGSSVALGAQNLFWENEGAYTGEVSGPMLKAAGVRYAIIGHSERRQYFGETDETVNRRLFAAAAAGLSPVVCVGETREEREAGKTFSVLDKQVQEGLKGWSPRPEAALCVAYEPVWAIGTGLTATDQQAQEAHAYIRGLLAKMLGRGFADATRILYGGSVKPGNIAGLMSMPDIDGGLVGGASLDPETFSRIVKFR